MGSKLAGSGRAFWIYCGMCGIAAFFSCNARVDGCLDREATNFNVTVDRNDPSLCQYPDMLLNVTYQWGDTLFRTNQVFDNAFGQPFIVTDFYILFSQFALNAEDGRKLTVDNMTSWYVGDQSDGESLDVTDDFTLVDLSTFSFSLGDWSTTTFVNTADFTVGVPDTLTPTLPDTLTSNRINDSRVFYNESAMDFATARFRIVRDTSTDLSDTYHITSGPIPFTFALNKDLNLGSTDTVRVAIDFQTLLTNVDLEADSASIASGIANVLEQSIIDNN